MREREREILILRINGRCTITIRSPHSQRVFPNEVTNMYLVENLQDLILRTKHNKSLILSVPHKAEQQ
jgi:hypothetical protein